MKYAFLALVLLLAACTGAAPPEASSSAVEPAVEPAPAQALVPVASGWVGKWVGPEGTYLELAEVGGAYTVTVQSLDGRATYDAVAIDDRVEFQRDGQVETIRASSGEKTGMKWLLDKKDCLTIKTGEGFCRD